MQELADKLNCAIIFISGHPQSSIQNLIAEKLLHSSPLLIGIGKECFYETKGLPEITENVPIAVQCHCGKNTNTFSCKGKSCPCYLAHQKCHEKCHCKRCSNDYGPRLQSRSKEKPCTCRTGCTKDRCDCKKYGWNCNTEEHR